MNISIEKFTKKINEIINKISNKEKGKIKRVAKILAEKYLEGKILYFWYLVRISIVNIVYRAMLLQELHLC